MHQIRRQCPPNNAHQSQTYILKITRHHPALGQLQRYIFQLQQDVVVHMSAATPSAKPSTGQTHQHWLRPPPQAVCRPFCYSSRRDTKTAAGAAEAHRCLLPSVLHYARPVKNRVQCDFRQSYAYLQYCSQLLQYFVVELIAIFTCCLSK